MPQKRVSYLTLLALAGAGLVTGMAPASASATRTFVSGKGADTNPCSVTAPCRSLQQAVSQTSAGGEVVVLDAAGYGTVTITQSISIVNDGVGTASISVPQQGVGVLIKAGSSDSVHLRGLEIDGNNAGQNYGVQVSSAGSVEIETSVIRRLDTGIYSASGANGTRLEIQNDTIGDNRSGLDLQGTGIVVAMDTVHMPHNANGASVALDSASSVNLRKCYLSGDGTGTGIYVFDGRVFISDSEIIGESQGVYANNGDAGIALDRSTVTANKYGLFNNRGTIYTYKTNSINYNTTADTMGTISTFNPG